MKRTIASFTGTAILSLGILACAAIPALAQDSSTATPPARAVRLSSVEGQVTVSQGGQQIADHAVANTPLFEGAQIVTGDDGRAEVQFEDGAVARIPPSSSLSLSVLRPGQTEILLLSGEGYFELQGPNSDHPTRVRFGSNLVTASGYTVFRVQLDQPPGDLAVFSGNAHLDGPDNTAIDLHGGESVELGQYNLAESIEPDSWDAWNSDRDQALTTAEADTTTATNSMPDNSNPAWSDLNQNGSWYNTPGDGYVWSPYDASNPGWDPYGDGYWMNEPAYGYVWVSGYPWGYMPFQCGAWNYYSSFGWGWAPGGCSPWWGGGGVWVFNLGHYPRGYQPPFRPHPGPHPGPIGPHHPIPGGHPVGPEPVIRVNRTMPSTGAPSLPPRDGRSSVMIAGSSAQPLPLTPARRSFARLSGPPQYTVRQRLQPARPAYVRPPEPARTMPAPLNRGGYAPYAPPVSHPSGSAPHPSTEYHPSSPPSHPSGGGSSHPSSTGGSHPSGGSSHPSGGGGSSHGSHK